MKALNLYAGIGGNRKDWPEHVEVTAVEHDEKIAAVYSKLYPADQVIVADAHAYLLENLAEFDFVWSSPPCQTHSKMAKATRHKRKRYVDLALYEEIMFLQRYAEIPWVVENVTPWYDPLIAPTFSVGRHLFWASSFCVADDVKRPKDFINLANMAGRNSLQDWLGIHFDEVVYYTGNHCPAQVLRNAVHPQIGRQIFEQLSSGIRPETQLPLLHRMEAAE